MLIELERFEGSYRFLRRFFDELAGFLDSVFVFFCVEFSYDKACRVFILFVLVK